LVQNKTRQEIENIDAEALLSIFFESRINPSIAAWVSGERREGCDRGKIQEASRYIHGIIHEACSPHEIREDKNYPVLRCLL
jgi:hypothetical protein